MSLMNNFNHHFLTSNLSVLFIVKRYSGLDVNQEG